ncbi:hypothetical protein G6F22_021189 [Rhizopus arrhizus]|nr:hypothetical protein G6F22_021189 [Rhizopus arrhizus]
MGFRRRPKVVGCEAADVRLSVIEPVADGSPDGVFADRCVAAALAQPRHRASRHDISGVERQRVQLAEPFQDGRGQRDVHGGPSLRCRDMPDASAQSLDCVLVNADMLAQRGSEFGHSHAGSQDDPDA